MDYESDNREGNNHSITSENILTCKETGRAIAVFYNDYDLNKLIVEMEERSAFKNGMKEMSLAEFVKIRRESRAIKNNLIKRAEERLEFSKAINRFSDVVFFEDLIESLKT